MIARQDRLFQQVVWFSIFCRHTNNIRSPPRSPHPPRDTSLSILRGFFCPCEREFIVACLSYIKITWFGLFLRSSWACQAFSTGNACIDWSYLPLGVARPRYQVPDMSRVAATHVSVCAGPGPSSPTFGRVCLLSCVHLGNAGGFSQPGESARRPIDRDPCHTSGTEITRDVWCVVPQISERTYR